MRSNSNRTKLPACFQCRFYCVTWDAQLPYGCSAHGFKSRQNPARVVYDSSGMECQLFAPKADRGPARRQN